MELDFTGYDDICVAAYRNLGVAPCSVGTVQPMQAQCLFPAVEVWERYGTQYIVQEITASTVRHSKDGGTTWYP